MADPERILTLHPAGKKGVNIEKKKYEQMRKALLTCLAETGPIKFTPLMQQVEILLEGEFEGSIMWYGMAVKQDLEARGILINQKGILSLAED